MGHGLIIACVICMYAWMDLTILSWETKAIMY